MIYSFLKKIVFKLNSFGLSKSNLPANSINPIEEYFKNGRKPWSFGYWEYRQSYIKSILDDVKKLTGFKDNLLLEREHGLYLDERTVEIPWVISRIDSSFKEILDAGSALNFNFVLNHPNMNDKKITICTLEPEGESTKSANISYVYGDLRNLYFKDETFDCITCISTLEHIGMDNSMYTNDSKFKENAEKDFLIALMELKRILKKGGTLFLTVPFGIYENHGYYQQFSSEMIESVIKKFQAKKCTEIYFSYTMSGWEISTKEKTKSAKAFNIHKSKYFDKNSTMDFDPDMASCSRAIAALELIK